MRQNKTLLIDMIIHLFLVNTLSWLEYTPDTLGTRVENSCSTEIKIKPEDTVWCRIALHCSEKGIEKIIFFFFFFA